ncbi:MAG: ATP-binding protein [Candidatus Diapherotrites archaeon]|nr:ATP-binding protein [Candidatus Diapherotrites archaeon]
MDYRPRLLETEVDRYLQMDKSVVIVGPRQSGKTTLLKHLHRKMGGSFVNAEEPGAREMLLSKRSGLLFVDEAQRIRDAGRVLKLLHDRGVRFVASGSGSFDVKVKVSGELVGRAARLVLLPLSFEEFIWWKDEGLLEQYRAIRDWVWSGDGEPPFREHPGLELLWREYVRFGGYPEVVKREEKEEILLLILDNYLDRDVVAELGVRSREAFLATLRLVAHSLGSPLSKNSVASTLGISYHTVEHYLSLMKETFVIFDVRPYSPLPSSLRKKRKYYFYDAGIYNWLLRDFRPLELRADRGKILENYVARALKERFGEIYYYRKNGGEVDFVGRDFALEVKTKKRRSRLLHRFTEEGKRAIVVYLGPLKKKDEVLQVPPWFI